MHTITCDSILVMIVSCSFPGSETHPQYVQPPVIPGHEFIGEVVKLGPGKGLADLLGSTPNMYMYIARSSGTTTF